MRSARGHSSRPPARIGRIIRPGENHVADTRTAAMPIPATATASTSASLRFRVMNCRLSRERMDSHAERAACRRRRGEPDIMMAKLYRGPLENRSRHPGRAGYEAGRAPGPGPPPYQPVSALFPGQAAFRDRTLSLRDQRAQAAPSLTRAARSKQRREPGAADPDAVLPPG